MRGRLIAVALLLVADAAAADELKPTAAARKAAADLSAGRQAEGLKKLEAAANGGDVYARILLGETYYFGVFGVARDPVRACTEFDRAKDLAGEAAHNYGQCLFAGDGLPKDLAGARIWYAKAADLGHVQSKCALGNMLVRGQGGPVDVAGGLTLCREAAEAGDADAQTDLGDYYYVGRVVPKDPAEARRWYEKAAAQDQANAAYALGVMSWNGDGGPADQAAADRWWRLADKNGNRRAAYHLGVYAYARFMAAHKPGDLSGLDEAIGWLGKAAADDPDPERRADAQRILKLARAIRDALASPTAAHQN